MLAEEFSSDLEKLMEVSGLINEYINDGSYLKDIDPSCITQESTLLEAYSLCLNELRTLGIEFLDREYLFSNFYTLRVLRYYRDFFSSQYIYEICSHDLEMKETILNTLEIDDFFLEEYLKVVASKKDCFSFLEEEGFNIATYDSETLKSHIEASLNLCHPELFSRVDPDEYEKVFNHVLTHRKVLLEHFEKIKSLLLVEPEVLKKRLYHHDNDKLDPKNIPLYANKEDLKMSPEGSEIYKNLQNEHHRNNPHHPDYWIKRNKKIDLLSLSEMVLDTFEDGVVEKDFFENFNKCMNGYDFSFTEQELDYIKTLVRAM